MTAVKPAIPPTAEAGLETVRVITETLRIVTDKRLELYNLTEKVADIVKRHDIKGMLNKVVSPKDEWRHNDPQHSDCDRQNAHSHLQATLLGHALSFPVTKGKLVLGQFQAIIAAELDGPRNRDVAIQIIGR